MTKTEPKQIQETTADERLAERVGELEQTIKSLQAGRSYASFKSFFRNVAVGLLVVLCALMVNLTTASLWLKQTIVDTDTWTAKTTALLQDQSVQADISAKVTEEIFASTDVEQLVSEAVPPRLSSLAGPLTESLRRFTTEKTSEILASDQFQTFWQNANKSAHSGIIASLENGGVAPENTDAYIVYINQDKLLLNLKPIIQNAQTRLADAGLGFVSDINTGSIDRTITLTEIQSLPSVLATFNFINKAAPLFAILAVLFGAGALALSRNRRKVVIALCVSVIVLMVLNVQALYFAQYPFIQQLSSTQMASTATAMAVYTIFTNDLITLNRLLMVIATIILAVALLSGPGKVAVSFREFIRRTTTPKNRSSFILAVERNRVAIVATVAVVAALLIIFAPIPGQVFPSVIVTVASLLSLWLFSLKPPQVT